VGGAFSIAVLFLATIANAQPAYVTDYAIKHHIPKGIVDCWCALQDCESAESLEQAKSQYTCMKRYERKVCAKNPKSRACKVAGNNLKTATATLKRSKELAKEAP
jgi:hypothetical protein